MPMRRYANSSEELDSVIGVPSVTSLSTGRIKEGISQLIVSDTDMSHNREEV
jgi:hypothetical protein